jgi:hypothetical protein
MAPRTLLTSIEPFHQQYKANDEPVNNNVLAKAVET